VTLGVRLAPFAKQTNSPLTVCAARRALLRNMSWTALSWLGTNHSGSDLHDRQVSRGVLRVLSVKSL
jgi:hypothetical protein